MNFLKSVALQEYIPVIEIDEMVDIFGYTNRRALIRAIRENRFEVPLFMLGNRKVAHVESIESYINKMKRAEIRKLDNEDVLAI